jgi:hypothetical protein
MFVLFNAGQPMTGHRMFESDEEVDDWQVSALAVGSLEMLKLICSCTTAYSEIDLQLYSVFLNTSDSLMCWSATEYEIDFFESAMLHCIFFWY